MIGVREVREHLRKQPFEPFRICMSDGRHYDVPHPDICILGANSIYVGVPDPEVKDKDVVMRVDHLALVHIVCFEPLTGRQNGRGQRKAR